MERNGDKRYRWLKAHFRPLNSRPLDLVEGSYKYLYFEVKMEQNWILEENLKPWLEIVASFCEYDFDQNDLDAINFGIVGTDVENNRWFDYEFSEGFRVLLQMALDPGSSVIFLKVECPSELTPRILTATEIASYYRLTR